MCRHTSLTCFKYSISKLHTCAFVSCSTNVNPVLVMPNRPCCILTKSPACSNLFVPSPTSWPTALPNPTVVPTI